MRLLKIFTLYFWIFFSLLLNVRGQDMTQLRNRLVDLNGFESIKSRKNKQFGIADFQKKVNVSTGAFDRANKRPITTDIKTDILQLALYYQDKIKTTAPEKELSEIKLILYRSLYYWLHDKPQFRWTDSALDQPRYVAAILFSLYKDLDKDLEDPELRSLVNGILVDAANYVRYSWNFGKSSSSFLSLGDNLNEDVQRMGNVGYRLYSLISISAAINNPGLIDTLSIIAKNQLPIKMNTGNEYPIALMPDFSLHQHNYGGSQIYNLGYGLDWYSDFVAYAYYAKGTKWALNNEELITLVNFLDHGLYPFFLPNGQVVDQVLGRHNQLPKYYSSFPVNRTKILRSFFDSGTPERMRIDKVLDDPNFTKDQGHRGFYTSDLMLTKTGNYSASVRFISDRTSGQESGDNGQKNGMENFFFSDGSFLLYKNNRESGKGAWDWRMVPGTTTELIDFPLPFVPYGKGYSNKKSFAGILEAKHGVLGSFTIDRTSPESTVTAVKSYALLEDLFLFEGHNINYSGKGKVVTTVTQEQVTGKVTLFEGDSEKEIMLGEEFEKISNKPIGVWHNNVGYLLLPSKSGSLKWGMSLHERRTRWQQLDSRNTGDESLLKLFSLNLVHGLSSRIEFPDYLYVVLPEISYEEFKASYNEGEVDLIKLGLKIESRSNENLIFYYKEDPYFMNFRSIAESKIQIDSYQLNISGLITGTICSHSEHLGLKFAQLEKRDNLGVDFTIKISDLILPQELTNDELSDKLRVTIMPDGSKIEGNSKPKNMHYFGSSFLINLPHLAN